MKNALRLLLTSAALAFGPALRADAVSDARAKFVDRDFPGMKSALDAHIKEQTKLQQTDETAHALRAIASAGLVVRDTIPALLKKSFGAQAASFDVGGFNLSIPRYKFTFAATLPFTNDGADTYSYSGVRAAVGGTRSDVPGLSIQNNSLDPYPLTLTFNLADGSPSTARLYFRVNDPASAMGLVETSGAAIQQVLQFAAEGSVAFFAGPGANEATIEIPAGAVLDIYLFESSGGPFSFSFAQSLPESLVLRNGQVLFSLTPVGPRPATVGALLAPAQTFNSAIASDLGKLSPGFELVLSPEESGSATNLVIAYPDAQLLLAEIRFYEALRHLGLCYNLGFNLTADTFDTDFLSLVRENPAFLSPLKDIPAARARTRALLKEGAAHYANASDAGLWTRSAPVAGGSYLFTLAAGADPEAEKLSYDTAFAQLAQSLDGPVPLADLSPDLAADPSVPADAALDLGAIFSGPLVNPRLMLPAFGVSGGVIRGSSTGLVNSGLFPGLGITELDNYLSGLGLVDSAETTDTAPFKIQRQSSTVTVAEGDRAQLAVFAQFYPPPSCQWQRLNAGAAPTLLDSVGPALVIPSASRADAGQYQVIVTDTRAAPPAGSPATVTSAPMTLVVTYPPEISIPPQGGAYALNGKVTLSVVAAGVPAALSYQWRKDGQIILKATKSTYSLAATQLTAGVYDVIITNAVGSTTSEPATIIVTAPPTIGTLPAQTFHVGDARSLAPPVRGSGEITYQWRRNGENLEDQTDSALAFPAVSTGDAGGYTLVATNAYGSTTSLPVAVRVNVPPAFLPVGSTVTLSDLIALTVQSQTTSRGVCKGVFDDGSTFEYKLGADSLRVQGILSRATLTRTSLGVKTTYALAFTTPSDATYPGGVASITRP